MTKLDALIERARTAPIDRTSAERYLRGLDHLLARPAAGDAMGSYEIVRQIGEGGMGVVYLGMHAILGRPAAIKVLLPELSCNRDIVGRFFIEARAAAAIRHPGIVDIYDFGFLADGAAYIAMEYLEGETLRARLRRQGRLSAGAVIQIGRQIAAALHAAHDKGITHRDLKPDNVFLISDPEIGERIKLLDFGIAKLADKDSAGPHTGTGVVLGTPVYMSPEQCRGASTLDSRSDLYSLGCILYELLAGRPVFDVEGANVVVSHHMYFQPEPVRTHAPWVPEPLDRLIESLLRKDPAMRPATAGEVVAILERCRTSVSVPVVDEPSAPAPAAAVPVALVPAAPVPAAAAPMAAVPTSITVFERPGGVATTLGGAAGAVSGDVAAIAGRRGARRTILLAGAALAVAAGIAITAGWPRLSPPAAIPAVAPAAPAPAGALPASSVPTAVPSTEVVTPPDAAAALPPPPAAPAQPPAPPAVQPAPSPPRAPAAAAPAAAPTTPARTPATKPKKLDTARPATPVVPPPVTPEPPPRSEEEILAPRR